jgi:hypothetical protein
VDFGRGQADAPSPALTATPRTHPRHRHHPRAEHDLGQIEHADLAGRARGARGLIRGSDAARERPGRAAAGAVQESRIRSSPGPARTLNVSAGGSAWWCGWGAPASAAPPPRPAPPPQSGQFGPSGSSLPPPLLPPPLRSSSSSITTDTTWSAAAAAAPSPSPSLPPRPPAPPAGWGRTTACVSSTRSGRSRPRRRPARAAGGGGGGTAGGVPPSPRGSSGSRSPPGAMAVELGGGIGGARGRARVLRSAAAAGRPALGPSALCPRPLTRPWHALRAREGRGGGEKRARGGTRADVESSHGGSGLGGARRHPIGHWLRVSVPPAPLPVAAAGFRRPRDPPAAGWTVVQGRIRGRLLPSSPPKRWTPHIQRRFRPRSLDRHHAGPAREAGTQGEAKDLITPTRPVAGAAGPPRRRGPPIAPISGPLPTPPPAARAPAPSPPAPGASRGCAAGRGWGTAQAALLAARARRAAARRRTRCGRPACGAAPHVGVHIAPPGGHRSSRRVLRAAAGAAACRGSPAAFPPPRPPPPRAHRPRPRAATPQLAATPVRCMAAKAHNPAAITKKVYFDINSEPPAGRGTG